jgi:hypothetical protein
METTIEQLQKANGGVWGSHPQFPREGWKDEVNEGSTNLGYWDWVDNQLDFLSVEEQG